jgi:hypothetical protein
LEERKRHATARRLVEEATQAVISYNLQAAANEGAAKALAFLLETSDLKEVYPNLDNPAAMPVEEVTYE